MIRAVLAVLVVVAILAVSQPAIQQGRQEHAATGLADEVEQFVEHCRDLVRSDEAIDGPGARRIVTLALPESGRFTGGASYLEIDGGDPSRIEWAIDGGDAKRRTVEGLRLRTPNGEPLTFGRAGDHRLLLALVGSPGDPVVEIRRFEPSRRDDDA